MATRHLSVTVSMPPEMADAIQEEAEELGLSFSEYIRRLTRRDFEDQLNLEDHPSLKERVFDGDGEPQTGAA